MPKLMCYSCNGYKKVMEENKWIGVKNVPDNVACIEICCTIDVVEYYGGLFGLADRPWFKHYEKSPANILVLFFDDITEDSRVIDEDRKQVARGMTDEQADKLVQFIDANIGKDFYIRCHAGKSRSQAVVQYMLDFYKDCDWELNKDNICDYNLINGRVFRMLKNKKLGYADAQE